MEVLQALVLKANLDQGSEQPDPTLQRIKGVAEDCLKRAHEMGIVRYPHNFLPRSVTVEPKQFVPYVIHTAFLLE